MLERTIVDTRRIDLAGTVAPLGRGPGDPCHRVAADGAIWHASRMPSGPVTFRLTQHSACGVLAQAWGTGAPEFLDGLDAMLCLTDDPVDFAPEHPILAEACRRNPGLRMLRTGLVFEQLVPTILEQKVHTVSARRSWIQLARRYGEPAPGPAPAGLLLPPTAETWRAVPSWVFHRANVGPQRAATIVRAARVADRLDALATRSAMETVAGIGEWTSAEVAQRALGDADAVSVGDFHLAKIVGWSLAGRPFTDAEMLDYLAPLRPHRYRAIRLLYLSGHARKPKFGPRTQLTDISGI